jgi:hypothetical protein
MLRPLSAIYQLYHDDSFSGGRSRSTRWEPPTMGKQLVNFIISGCKSVHPFCNLQSRVRTHAVLVIGSYELLGNPTIYVIEPPVSSLTSDFHNTRLCCKYHRTICLKAMRSIVMLFYVVISTALIFGMEPWFAFIVSIVKHHGKNFSYNSFVLRVEEWVI